MTLTTDQQILQWDFESKDDPLPARVIYEKILPDIVSRLVDPPVPYWFGSPYGGKGWDTADPTVGDVVSTEIEPADLSTNGTSGQVKN